MSSQYAVLPKADNDLDDIAYYFIEQENLDLGIRFLVASHETFSLLATHPEMGWKPTIEHPELATVRVFRVRGFERVLIFYRLQSEHVEIVRVLHGSQDLKSLFEREGSP